MQIDDFIEIGRLHSQSARFKEKWKKAVLLCAEQLTAHQSAYVACSGGKDSNVLVYLVAEAAKTAGKSFKVWSHISDASFPGTEETVKKVCEAAGVTPDIFHSPYSAFERVSTDKQKRAFGKSGAYFDSVREFAKDKDLCFTGVRAFESKRRMRAARVKGQVFRSESMGHIDCCYPLLWFRLEDIAAATYKFSIPVHPIYRKQPIDMGKNSNGEDRFIRRGYITPRDLLDKGTVVFLTVNYPDILKKLRKFFPDIGNYT